MDNPNERLIHEFCAAWRRRDIDELIGRADGLPPMLLR